MDRWTRVAAGAHRCRLFAMPLVALLIVLPTPGHSAAPADLRIYNWELFLDPKLVAEFSRRTGVKIRQSYFDSDRERDLRLTAGGTSDFDLVMVDAAQVEVYRKHGWAEPIGLRHVPALSNYDDRWRNLSTATANALQGAAQKCLDAGMDHYLAKPFTFEDLRGALDAQLQGRLGAPPAVEPLDHKALNALSRIDVRGAASLKDKVVQVYLQSADGFVRELLAALAAGDFGAAGAAASALKSGSADVGAVSLIDLCTQLEAKIRASDPAAADKLGRCLMAEYDRVIATLAAAHGNCAA